MFTPSAIEEAAALLGQLLADRGLSYEVVAIGGGGLLLLGITDRPTEDLDLVAIVSDQRLLSAQPLPSELLDAAHDVARLLKIDDDWLNPGPTSLLRCGLPDGFMERAEIRTYGGIVIRLASRFDQIHFKLFATSAPGDKHHVDLVRMRPTAEELRAAARWAYTHDPSEGFAIVTRQVLASFGVVED